MKKVVLQLDVHDEKYKRKAMKMVSTLPGLDSVSMNMKDKKMTLTGDIDPVAIVSKLRKVYETTEIISVETVKEPEKKKDEPKKVEAQKKEEPKKDQAKKQEHKVVPVYYNPPSYPVYYHSASVEEDPTACVIC